MLLMMNIVIRVGCHPHYYLFTSITYTKPNMGVIQAPMILKEGIHSNTLHTESFQTEFS